MGRIERSRHSSLRILRWSPPKPCGGEFVEVLLFGLNAKAELHGWTG
jgi:hypothetical protein